MLQTQQQAEMNNLNEKGNSIMNAYGKLEFKAPLPLNADKIGTHLQND